MNDNYVGTSFQTVNVMVQMLGPHLRSEMNSTETLCGGGHISVSTSENGFHSSSVRTSAVCGDMYTTGWQTTQHADSSSYRVGQSRTRL